MMLIYLPEDDAFYCFVAALKDPRFNLRRLYLPAMADAQKVLFVYGESSHLYYDYRRSLNQTYLLPIAKHKPNVTIMKLFSNQPTYPYFTQPKLTHSNIITHLTPPHPTLLTGELCRQHLRGNGLWPHVEKEGVMHSMFATEWCVVCRDSTYLIPILPSKHTLSSCKGPYTLVYSFSYTLVLPFSYTLYSHLHTPSDTLSYTLLHIPYFVLPSGY